ncbi:MAG TPA: response regulator transcription factor [Opitutaceae bacterium]|nr:response regulator transcription factor [Opitutaceae bacterium]HOR24523.1 response regulator transcription factor [Opitutaceae bacterium]HPK48839.1 response regulator transcription factor [Opitutaceae bacterium]
MTPRPATIRILLVDDHILMRMGLVTATNGEPDMKVVGEVENGDEAIEACRRHAPDVIVLDLRMPKKNGFETIRELREEGITARVLVFSNYASGDEIDQAFKAGAQGFVVKDMPLERLLEAIRAVHRGEQYLPPEIAARLDQRTMSPLTPRELEVLKLVAKGLSNKEISDALHLVEGTVKLHITNILTKLNVSARTQAILAGVKRGLIELE